MCTHEIEPGERIIENRKVTRWGYENSVSSGIVTHPPGCIRLLGCLGQHFFQPMMVIYNATYY